MTFNYLEGLSQCLADYYHRTWFSSLLLSRNTAVELWHSFEPLSYQHTQPCV